MCLCVRDAALFSCFAPVKISTASHAHLRDTCTEKRALCYAASCGGLLCFHLYVASVLQQNSNYLFFPPAQVINIINAAQESSPVTVAEALDRVLEILRTTELYSPQLASKEDDPHTNDLVGGLMNVRGRCRCSLCALKFIQKYRSLKHFHEGRFEIVFTLLKEFSLHACDTDHASLLNKEGLCIFKMPICVCVFYV